MRELSCSPHRRHSCLRQADRMVFRVVVISAAVVMGVLVGAAVMTELRSPTQSVVEPILLTPNQSDGADDRGRERVTGKEGPRQPGDDASSRLPAPGSGADDGAGARPVPAPPPVPAGDGEDDDGDDGTGDDDGDDNDGDD